MVTRIGNDGQNSGRIKRDPAEDAPLICSALNFDGVHWPDDYSRLDQVAFSLAINVTGSFEGHAGWTTISNNFDGQGVSLGILNQNLGQGTLQPLLIKMRDSHPDVLQASLTDSMLKSLLKMLDDWEADQPDLVDVTPSAVASDKRRFVVTESSEDIESFYGVLEVPLRSNSDSVNWAVKNLYTDVKGRKFKPSWKSALKQIAGHPAYVSFQIEAARWRHERALDYKARLGWTELRAYLFLFDIVVQNGSLKDKHFDKYFDWLKRNPSASVENQLLEMLEIRVVDSHKQWQADVRSRKKATILGQGEVHGEQRNLPEEYCYDPQLTY